MKNLTKEEWKEAIAANANAVILDVRTPGECAEGIQPNAVQLNVLNGGAFMNGLVDLDTSKEYYVYCRSGARSGSACGIMESKGLTSYNLIGGMMEWDGEVIKATQNN
ncbi:MAG: rhodanese-related sulfurtransferase [Crocinitomicaceae bacterium]|jgi:rhodanese-related sulfurtransferase